MRPNELIDTSQPSRASNGCTVIDFRKDPDTLV